MRRDALTVIFDHTKILYGNLVTYGGKGLRQLWDLIFSEDSTLVGKGLLGVGLHNSVIVWLNRKPKGLRNITGQFAVARQQSPLESLSKKIIIIRKNS